MHGKLLKAQKSPTSECYPLLGNSHTALIHTVVGAVVVLLSKAFKTTEMDRIICRNTQPQQHFEVPLSHVLPDICTEFFSLLSSWLKHFFSTDVDPWGGLCPFLKKIRTLLTWDDSSWGKPPVNNTLFLGTTAPLRPQKGVLLLLPLFQRLTGNSATVWVPFIEISCISAFCSDQQLLGKAR